MIENEDRKMKIGTLILLITLLLLASPSTGFGCCKPAFDIEESGECGCYAFECEGTRVDTYSWYCEEYDGGCPWGTDCVETDTHDCYYTISYDCIGDCLTYGTECQYDEPVVVKAPRCLCGCK